MKGPKHINIGLNTLFDLSPDLLCLLDQHGCFLKINKYLRLVLGYQENEMLSKNFLDFIHPEDRESSMRQWKALAQNEPAFLFKNRYRCASGFYKSFSWNAVQLPDKTCYATAREITKYIKTQNQLAKALTDNQKIYNNSLDVLCAVNAEGQFTRVSKAAKTVWGYEEQELLGKYYLDFVHPDDVALTIATEREIKLGRHKTNFENHFIHKNGAVVPLIWSAQWLPLEQTLFATARDATEREKQKEKLLFNERRLEALIKSGNDLIGILSAEGVYLYVSPSVNAILNLSPEDFVGKTPFDFIHPQDVERVKNAFAYILTTTDIVHISPFQIKNGSADWSWVETFATNLLHDPAINGVVVNSRDVSIKIKDEEEKRLAAKKLQQQNDRLKEIAQINSHVIRRPVATILGLMDILDKKSIHGHENQEILEYLEVTTKELDTVIKRINDMSID